MTPRQTALVIQAVETLLEDAKVAQAQLMNLGALVRRDDLKGTPMAAEVRLMESIGMAEFALGVLREDAA